MEDRLKEKVIARGEELSPLKAHHCKGFQTPMWVQGFVAAVELLWPLIETLGRFDRNIASRHEATEAFIELQKN